LLQKTGYQPEAMAEAFRKAAAPPPRSTPSLRKARPTPLP
jgi:predicted Zn-dependent protease